MDEDRPEDTSPSPDSGRAKRPPPTIDLEASEVSGETQGTNARRRRRAAQAILSGLSRWPSAATMSATLVGRRYRRGNGRAGDRGRLGGGMAGRDGFADGDAAGQCRGHRHARRPASPISRRGRSSLRPQRLIRRWLRGLTRWKNPLRRCAPNSRAPARSPRNWPRISMRSNRRRARPPRAGSRRDQRTPQPDRTRRPRRKRGIAQDNQARGRCGASPRRRGIHARRFGSAG